MGQNKTKLQYQFAIVIFLENKNVFFYQVGWAYVLNKDRICT